MRHRRGHCSRYQAILPERMLMLRGALAQSVVRRLSAKPVHGAHLSTAD